MASYVLYCGASTVFIGNLQSADISDYATIEYYPTIFADILDGKISGDIHIPGDAEALLSSIMKDNKYIEAAGGYVLDNEGKSLVIIRNGLYDLPKGKVEPGEEIPVAAVREVEEETGIAGPRIECKLLDTYHFYRWGNDPTVIFKKTYWFKMSHQGGATNPQTEEGITDCLWVSDNEISGMVEKTHRNLKILFQLKMNSKI